MAHIAKRADVWYVPMGPLYAYRALRDATMVRKLSRSRFAVSNPLDLKIYNGSVTLLFDSPRVKRVIASGAPLLEFSGIADRWETQYYRRDGRLLYITVKPNTTLEIAE
jgi:hypothetical protein